MRRVGRHAPGPVKRLGGRLSFVFSQVFLTISPTVPVDLRKCLADTSVRQVALSSFVYGLFFSLFGTAFFSWLDGTLIGSDPARRYFLEDGWNIALYVLVTPTYVALASWLILLTTKHWATLADFSTHVAASPAPSRPRRISLALVIALVLCSVFITNYMHDILSPDHVGDVYWFMESHADGTRSLNRAGYYYVALNFFLLLLTLLGIAAFFSITVEVFRIGNALHAGRVREFPILREKLETFTTAYLLAKLLAATYMVNAFIWKDSPLGQTSNLIVAGLALTIVGVFFLAIPRLFIELKWFQYATLASPGPDDDDAYRDIRPRHVKLWAHVLDVLLIGGFVTAFWELDVSFGGLLELLR